MTPKEAFQRIESVIELADDSVNTNTATGRELEEAIIRINDNIKLVRQALTELEELKRDVKRYFELWEQAREKWGNGLDDVEAYEYAKLHLKLSKVGKKDV